MNFDPTILMLSLIPGGVGYVLFTYGRKEGRWPQLVTGLALMIYPYFTETVGSMAAVGALLCATLYVAVQLGW